MLHSCCVELLSTSRNRVPASTTGGSDGGLPRFWPKVANDSLMAFAIVVDGNKLQFRERSCRANAQVLRPPKSQWLPKAVSITRKGVKKARVDVPEIADGNARSKCSGLLNFQSGLCLHRGLRRDQGICYPASCGARVRPNLQRIMIARRKSTILKFFDVELAELGTISRLIR